MIIALLYFSAPPILSLTHPHVYEEIFRQMRWKNFFLLCFVLLLRLLCAYHTNIYCVVGESLCDLQIFLCCVSVYIGKNFFHLFLLLLELGDNFLVYKLFLELFRWCTSYICNENTWKEDFFYKIKILSNFWQKKKTKKFFCFL